MYTLFNASATEIPKWAHPNEFFSLFICFICKYILTIMGLVCTIPSGVFGPIFSMGAMFGRMYGHIIYKVFKVNMESGCSMVAQASQEWTLAVLVLQRSSRTCRICLKTAKN